MTSTTTTSSSSSSDLFQQFLALLKADFLSAFGGPLLTFLQADAAAGSNVNAIIAAALQLQANVLAALPQNAPTYVAQLGQLNTALAELLATKLQSVLTAAPAAASTAG